MRWPLPGSARKRRVHRAQGFARASVLRPDDIVTVLGAARTVVRAVHHTTGWTDLHLAGGLILPLPSDSLLTCYRETFR